MLTRLRWLFPASMSAPARKRRSLQGSLSLESLEERAAPAAVAQGAVADTSSSSSSSSSSTAQTSLTSQDQSYLTRQAQGDQQEIILGSLAMQNSSNASVKAYGQELVTDHSKDLSNLIPILQQYGISLPSLSSDQLQHIQTLGALHGTQFDQQFLAFMVQDHLQDINDNLQELSQGAAGNSTAEGEALASLPVLEKHLTDAYTLEQQLTQQGSSSQGSSSQVTGLQNNGSQNGSSQEGSSQNSSSDGSSQNSSGQGNDSSNSDHDSDSYYGSFSAYHSEFRW